MLYANHDIENGKGLYKVVIGLLIRTNDTPFNLGNHNALLETNYDFMGLNDVWAHCQH